MMLVYIRLFLHMAMFMNSSQTFMKVHELGGYFLQSTVSVIGYKVVVK